MKTHPKNTVTEIYTHYGLKITWKMSGLPGMERPWFYQNLNNQLREVQKQEEGGTNRLRTQLYLTQVVFHVRGSSGSKVEERAEYCSSILSEYSWKCQEKICCGFGLFLSVVRSISVLIVSSKICCTLMFCIVALRRYYATILLISQTSLIWVRKYRPRG
jgi:hypothetical protein